MPRIPRTLTRTSHALSIKANGITVGLINGWNTTSGRTVTPVFEVGSDGSGVPIENVGGNATNLTITINRYDLYTNRMEEAFGTPDVVMLTRQSDPFELVESWKLPESTEDGEVAFTGEERFVYSGCWFTSVGRTIRSDDNRIVNANATLIYAKKLKVTGLSSGLSFGFIG